MAIRPVTRFAGTLPKAGNAEAECEDAFCLAGSQLAIADGASEGSYSQGRNCRARFFNALGSAGEVRACLDVSEAMQYVETIDPELRDKLDHVIATVYRLTLR